MELRIGYFPVLDAALALRQAFEAARYSPFNDIMESIRRDLGDEGRALVDGIGEKVEGWLAVLEALLAGGAAGTLGLEEALVRLERSPIGAIPLDPGLGGGEELDRAAAALLARVLRLGVGPEASRRSRALLDATDAIARGIGEFGLWEELFRLSDRIYRAGPGLVGFRMKPELVVREEEVGRVLVTPSTVATRRLTFCKRGSDFVFFVAAGGAPRPDEPSEGLILSTLALADGTRLKMLRRLSGGAMGNGEMADYLGVNPSTASRHFKLFRDAGFVEQRSAEGARSEYLLLPEAIESALGEIINYIKSGE